MDIDELRREIAQLRELGASVSDVQRSVIDAAHELSDEERALLWLFAWSCPSTNTYATRPVQPNRPTEPEPRR